MANSSDGENEATAPTLAPDVGSLPTLDSGTPAGPGDAHDPTLLGVPSGSATPGPLGPLGGDLRAPVRLGRFVLLERLGAGGMGMVFAGFDEKLERKVALKLLKPALGHDPEVKARLLREAQALAQLSHPNVVAVYEVGSLPEGDVFIAMEFIKGETLRQWQRRHRDDWRRVVATYHQAGVGLGAAHRAGIVHRDFKPDNVLVGEDGRVRVVDFGLARAEPSASEASGPGAQVGGADEGTTRARVPLTLVGQILGTPGYMAPEQWAGLAMDARTDQFSFCVALFEALYGERPYADRAFVMDGGATPPLRRTRPEPDHPRWLWEALVRGLAVDPAGRFASMDELLGVLGHDHERTRRRLIAGTAFLGTVLVVGVASALVTGRLDRRARCVAAPEELAGIWDAAHKQRVRAALASTGLPFAGQVWRSTEAALDRYAARWLMARQAACEATYVQHTQSPELLDRRMECLAGRKRSFGTATEALARQPVEAAAHTGELLESLGEIDLCADTGALLGSLEVPAKAEATARLGELRRHVAAGTARMTVGDLAGARQELAAARTLAERLGYTPAQAETLYLEGRLELEEGQVASGIKTLRRAADLAVSSRHDELGADIWLRLGLEAGPRHPRPDEAFEWVRQGEAWLARLDHPHDLRRITADAARGAVQLASGEVREALATLTRAIEAGERAFGKDSVRLVRLLRDRAHALGRLGEAQRAVADAERALHLSEAAWGPLHPQTAQGHRSLGLLYIEQLGAIDKGVQEIEQALRILRPLYGDDSIEVANCEQALGEAHLYRGDYAAALQKAEHADAVYRRRFGLRHPWRGESAMNVGVLRFFTKDYPGSLRAYEEAYDILEPSLGAGHATVGVLLSNTGETLLTLGKNDQAIASFERALAILRRTSGPEHADLALPYKGMGLGYLASHRPQEAQEPLEKALRLHDSAPVDPQEGAEIRWALARVLRALGEDTPRQRVLATEALKTYRALGPAWTDRVRDIERFVAL